MTTSEKYRRRIAKLMARIARLETELQAERSLRRAIADLEFAPVQEPRKLKTLRRYTTIHSKITKPPTP